VRPLGPRHLRILNMNRWLPSLMGQEGRRRTPRRTSSFPFWRQVTAAQRRLIPIVLRTGLPPGGIMPGLGSPIRQPIDYLIAMGILPSFGVVFSRRKKFLATGPLHVRILAKPPDYIPVERVFFFGASDRPCFSDPANLQMHPLDVAALLRPSADRLPCWKPR
jgi:hypothetical protein